MDYFEILESETYKLYDLANAARAKGLDITKEVETPLTKDLAERVEGLVGPKNIAKRIKELEDEMDREALAFKIAAEISDGTFKLEDETLEKVDMADQAIRTALAILTEGVVAAPLEGIAKVGIKNNFDGTQYLAVYFAGPIRSAGGTAAALGVLLGDRIRRSQNLDIFKPIEAEIERYVEEAELYESEVTNLQYSPKPEELRIAAKNIPVEVTGEPTDKIEVSHRDLERVETNNIRGGALLAIVEGIIQKAPKIAKYTKNLDLYDKWEWLEEEFVNKKKQPKIEPKTDEDKAPKSEKIEDKYIQDIIGGRPVLGYPSEKGAFRLRYGRSRNTGLAAMGVHPATMQLLEFLAIGTQLKIEKPGKGTCVVPVDSIEGPVVKLKNGDVLRIYDVKGARAVKGQVEEILFLGDMLVAFGEFLRNNQDLLPAGWCEEWWIETIKNSPKYSTGDKVQGLSLEELLTQELSFQEAQKISQDYDVPLHPFYTYPYHDATAEDINLLLDWLSEYRSTFDLSGTEDLVLKIGPAKRILEILGIPHTIIKDDDGLKWVHLDYNDASALLSTLTTKIPLDGDVTESINEIAPFKINKKSPTYLGSRVGRPEKSKERLMRPAPHSLFPIGNAGGTKRNALEAVKKNTLTIDISRARCPECQKTSFFSVCPYCGADTEKTEPANRKINISRIFKKAAENVDIRKIDEVKCVKGMISESKFPEPFEKGILRAKNEVFTFKDATIRHDSTDLPLTHFIPEEIGVPYTRILELGYTHDAYGEPITNDQQIIELKVQDVVVSDNCGEYLVKVTHFIDDLLTRYYHMDSFYNVKTRDDLVGHLIVGLAPHTSAGVLGRVLGFTKSLACYAHPYFHSAKRRNCDSDEDSIMLLLDSLLNFSKSYLPSTRGGSMDAPLVLSSRIDPEEIDDESHKIDVMSHFSEEFFEETLKGRKPSDVLNLIENVKNRLGTPAQYEDLMFSHHTSSIHAGPRICLYKTLPSMNEKVAAQINLAEKIRAVDEIGVVEGVLSSHFLPDMMGNMRAFSRQKVRCTKCGAKYRRVPLSGECSCGSNLILSVSKGSVVKYLEISKDLVRKYPLNPYLNQRIDLLELSMNSLFESDKSKQSSLDIFL